MFRSPRLFAPKNRRTSFSMTPWQLSGQPVEDRIRMLRQQWLDFLVLPSCLIILALYEWWRWLFSVPANPFLLSMVAAASLSRTWRRGKAYKEQLSQAQATTGPYSGKHIDYGAPKRTDSAKTRLIRFLNWQ